MHRQQHETNIHKQTGSLGNSQFPAARHCCLMLHISKTVQRWDCATQASAHFAESGSLPPANMNGTRSATTCNFEAKGVHQLDSDGTLDMCHLKSLESSCCPGQRHFKFLFNALNVMLDRCSTRLAAISYNAANTLQLHHTMQPHVHWHTKVSGAIRQQLM